METSVSSKLGSWNSNTDCCFWGGVKCDEDGHVISLDLSLEFISGGLDDSSSLFKLQHLQNLNLAYNIFDSKQIPSGFDLLVNLTNLNMSNSGFTGQIPIQISRLTKLVSLDLSFFSPGISPLKLDDPDLGKLIRNLSELRVLRLDGVNISAEGSKWCQDLSSSLPKLKVLSLSNCQLSGPFNESLLQLGSLYEIELDLNNISAQVPDFFVENLDMFQKFRKLSRLDLSGNSFSIDTGGVNSALFPQVGTLKLRSCNLSVFPEFLRNQYKLNHLDLSRNQIRGKIPNWLSMIGNGSLIHLNLSNNYLEDPDQPFLSFKFLESIDLHSNILQGKNFILSPFTIFLDYSNNRFNSTIPTNIGSHLSVTIFFSLSSNGIVGGIPMSVCQAKYLQVLDLSNNRFSGRIPECLVSIPGLSILNLRGNNFSGTMPRTISGSCSLRKLDLNGNRLEGQIPKSMANCTMVEVLDLGNNLLNGTFPYWLGNLTQLRVLVLRFNKFHGSLEGGQQTDNNHFPKLQIIDISSNKFSGNLTSKCFMSWKAMMINKEEDHSNYKSKILRFGFLELSQLYYEDAVTVASKGLDMELVKILTIFTSIDLSNNGFEGEIPDVIGSLGSLNILNLSRNALTGRMPSSLGNLTQLESLDLSKNQLTGEIPGELAYLSFLSFLNLSFNKLVGKIPLGTQIQSFNAMSFEGNDGFMWTSFDPKLQRRWY